MLVRSSQWVIDNFAEGSRPHANTVKKWVQDGKLEGTIISNVVYVESTALSIHKAKPKSEKPTNTNVRNFTIS